MIILVVKSFIVCSCFRYSFKLGFSRSFMKFKIGELETIADELRVRIIGNRAVTLADYISFASSKKGDEIGLFYLWAVKTNPCLGKYFPDEVFDILKKKTGKHYFSVEEKQFLKENAPNGVKYLAWKLNVPPHTVLKQAGSMNVSVARRNYDPYSSEETALVLSESAVYTDRELARKITGRRRHAIQCKRLRMGIKKQIHMQWEDFPEKEAYLMRSYKSQTCQQIADHLGLRYHQVKTKIERLQSRGELSS